MSYFDEEDSSLFGESDEIDIEEFLQESNEKEKQRLKNELERIRVQLFNRAEIHERIIDNLNSKIEDFVGKLEELYSGFGTKEKNINRVIKKLYKAYSRIQNENRSYWQDKQDLEKEKREIIRELEELEDESLKKLLEDLNKKEKNLISHTTPLSIDIKEEAGT